MFVAVLSHLIRTRARPATMGHGRVGAGAITFLSSSTASYTAFAPFSPFRPATVHWKKKNSLFKHFTPPGYFETPLFRPFFHSPWTGANGWCMRGNVHEFLRHMYDYNLPRLPTATSPRQLENSKITIETPVNNLVVVIDYEKWRLKEN